MVVIATEEGPDVQMARNAEIDCVVIKENGEVEQMYTKADISQF